MIDEIEEELRIIEERDKETKRNLALALSVDEPIENVMYRDPVVVSKNIKIIDAINLFNEKDVGSVLVVDDSTKKLIGIFTERDVIRKIINKDHDIHKETIEKFMTKNPDFLHLNDPVSYALNRMAAGGYRHVPLVDEKNILQLLILLLPRQNPSFQG